MITETITWTLLKDKWPEVSDEKLSLVVKDHDENGEDIYATLHGCQCFRGTDDNCEPPQTYRWFCDQSSLDIEWPIVIAWSPEPTGKPVIETLYAQTCTQNKPRNSLIPFDSELS